MVRTLLTLDGLNLDPSSKGDSDAICIYETSCMSCTIVLSDSVSFWLG